MNIIEMAALVFCHILLDLHPLGQVAAGTQGLQGEGLSAGWTRVESCQTHSSGQQKTQLREEMESITLGWVGFRIQIWSMSLLFLTNHMKQRRVGDSVLMYFI